MLSKAHDFKEDPWGKFKPNFEEPYVVVEVLLGRALYLSGMDEGSPHELINVIL